MKLQLLPASRELWLKAGFRTVGIQFWGNHDDGDVDYVLLAPEPSFPLRDSVNWPDDEHVLKGWRLLVNSSMYKEPEKTKITGKYFEVKKVFSDGFEQTKAVYPDRKGWFALLDELFPNWRYEQGSQGRLYVDMETGEYCLRSTENVITQAPVNATGKLSLS